MLLTDTHFHADDYARAGDLAAVLERAVHAGVARIVAVGGNAAANALAAEEAGRHAGCLWAAAGYDRDQAGVTPDLDALAACMAAPRIVAIGEIGLDYHYHPETAGAQKALFAAMLDFAAGCGRPVLVHSREADADTLDLLGEYVRKARCRGGPGVLHCFTGTPEFARRLLDLGLMISFSGILTFKNARAIGEAAALVPDERLLVESDAPLLAPEPFRGRRNEPAYVVHTLARLAEIRHCPAERLADITSRNAERVFGFGASGATALAEEMTR